MSRKYDVVIWGATGYTGTLIAEYLARRGDESLRWAIAGRSKDKLEKVNSNLNANADILIGSLTDKNSLLAITSAAKVVIAAAGPFTLHGEPIVAACVESKTHYVDITGETPWVRKMIDRYHDKALENQVHIVPLCGFDSVPFDIGAFMVAKEGAKHGGLKWVKGFPSAVSNPSGGTIHTIIHLVSTTSPRVMADPYLLNPPEHQKEKTFSEMKDHKFVGYDKDIKAWTSPFIMSGANTRVVRRSQYLYQDNLEPYGPEGFYYNEAEKHRTIFGALKALLFLGLLGASILFPLTRAIVRRVVPSPGEGPSKASRDKSWFRVDFVGETIDNKKIYGKVSGGDAYDATAIFAANAALCLLDPSSLPMNGGVLTPATSMGENLITKLQEAGMTLTTDYSPIP